MKLEILNTVADARTEALVKQSYRLISPRWKKILPKIQVRVVRTRFDLIPELAETVRMFNKNLNKRTGYKVPRKLWWERRQTLWHKVHNDKYVLYVRFAPLSPNDTTYDYDFKKDILFEIAVDLWDSLADLRKVALEKSTGIASEREDLCFYAFVCTWPRFFLNPSYLADKKPDAWRWMVRLDKVVRAGKFQVIP